MGAQLQSMSSAMKAWIGALLLAIAVAIPCLSPATAYAWGDYSSLYVIEEETTITVPEGEIGTVTFGVYNGAIKHERCQLEIYDSYGEMIASGTSKDFYTHLVLGGNLSFTFDTADHGMSVGEYTFVYYIEFFETEWRQAPEGSRSFSIWVVPNTCNGKHSLKLVETDDEATCQEAGWGKYECSKCGYFSWDDIPAGNHKWDSGVYTLEPTEIADGMIVYTCILCDATKTDVAPALGHTWDMGVGVGDSRQFTCVGCGETRIISNVWRTFPDVAAAVNKKGSPCEVWYVSDGWLGYVVNNGLMGGYTNNGNFGPNDSILRGQVATILYRAACANDLSLESIYGSTTDKAAYAKTSTFSDLKADKYYTAAINWARETGIMTGDASTGYTTVRPDASISRQELCAMLSRFAEYFGEDVASGQSLSKYPDASKVAGWARSSVQWAVENGILGGADKLNPTSGAKRAEAAKMLTVTLRDVM